MQLCQTTFIRTIPAHAPQVDELLATVGHIAFIAGGAARELVMPGVAPPAMDVDVFLYSASSYEEARQLIGGLGYAFFGYTENAACFDPRSDADLAVQLICPNQDPLACTAGRVEDVLSHFSFTTEQFGITHNGTAIVGADAMSDTRDRLLCLVNVNDPLAVACRATKYAAKGYFMPMHEMHSLFLDWERKSDEWKRQVAIAQAANREAI